MTPRLQRARGPRFLDLGLGARAFPPPAQTTLLPFDFCFLPCTIHKAKHAPPCSVLERSTCTRRTPPLSPHLVPCHISNRQRHVDGGRDIYFPPPPRTTARNTRLSPIAARPALVPAAPPLWRAAILKAPFDPPPLCPSHCRSRQLCSPHPAPLHVASASIKSRCCPALTYTHYHAYPHTYTKVCAEIKD
jgi:hypothetical protein